MSEGVFMSGSGEVAVRAEERRSASAACWASTSWWAESKDETGRGSCGNGLGRRDGCSGKIEEA